jgi:hypothetical protein
VIVNTHFDRSGEVSLRQLYEISCDEIGGAVDQGLHASFVIVDDAGGKPVDHDWIYRHPRLFVDHLKKTGSGGSDRSISICIGVVKPDN